MLVPCVVVEILLFSLEIFFLVAGGEILLGSEILLMVAVVVRGLHDCESSSLHSFDLFWGND